MFTDVQNSTKLWDTEPDAMNEGLETHDRVLREILAKFRGYEVKTEGVGVFPAVCLVCFAVGNFSLCFYLLFYFPLVCNDGMLTHSSRHFS